MSAATDWLDFLTREGVELVLASSVACVLILLLRGWVRRAFGARVAYALWWLLPVTMGAVLLPAPTSFGMAPALGWELPPGASAAAASGMGTPSATWLSMLLIWLIGASLALIRLVVAQRRFLRSLGRIERREGDLWQAEGSAGLPALVGLIPRIVLPADFEQCYSAEQRRLIIEHERVHARRGDNLWNLLFALLAALCWFNPLLRLAQRAFQLDQELACDACVLAHFPEGRQCYGAALLLPTSSTAAAPLGGPAFRTHPLKERITMLTRPLPSRRRLTAGFAFALGLGITAAGLAWAHQPPQIAVTDAATAKPTPATEAPAASPMNRAPSVLAVKPPRYPPSALAEGVEGTSMVFVQIRADGSVAEARIDRSSGNEALDAAALEVVRQWTFNPARRNGQAIDGSSLIPVRFSLDLPAAHEGSSTLPPSAD